VRGNWPGRTLAIWSGRSLRQPRGNHHAYVAWLRGERRAWRLQRGFASRQLTPAAQPDRTPRSLHRHCGRSDLSAEALAKAEANPGSCRGGSLDWGGWWTSDRAVL